MISVITTAYNIEAYIEECLQSIIKQTLKDLEIIVVEDCSTDGTLDKINNVKDPRIKLIRNKENIGAGRSRQVGIDNSTGDYIIFIDGDDYISEDFIESLYNAAIQENADFVETDGITILENNGHSRIDTRAVFLNKCLTSKEIYNTVQYCPRRFIEDVPTRYHIECVCKKHVIIHNDGYTYRIRSGSLTYDVPIEKFLLYTYLGEQDIERFSMMYNKPVPKGIESKWTLSAMIVKGTKFSEIEQYLEYVDEDAINMLKQKLN